MKNYAKQECEEIYVTGKLISRRVKIEILNFPFLNKDTLNLLAQFHSIFSRPPKKQDYVMMP